MEMKELMVEETEQGSPIAAPESEDAAITPLVSEDLAATLAIEPIEQPPRLPVPLTSLLPTLAGLWQLTLDWQPTEQQQAQFQQLYTLILAGNQQFNLTRITEPMEFWEKHLWDSLVGVKAFLSAISGQQTAISEQWSAVSDQATTEDGVETVQASIAAMPFRAIDIGTGAGFPGIPVAIAQPLWTVTLLDSTRKKMTFVDQVLASLGLTNAITLAERVEQVGRQKHQRQTYDLAFVRAVAAATVCAEYALPLLKLGGCAVLYRGQWTMAETTALEAAAAQLGGAIESVESLTTPLTHSVRHCIVLRKIAPTPNEFPRAIGVPAQNPLGVPLEN